MKKTKMLLLVLAGLGVLFLALIVLSFQGPFETEAAVVPVRGAIAPGSVEASPGNVREQVQKAREEGAQAFIFEINSPGGTVVASRQIERIISDVDELTVCQFKDYATSGAYWAASACDEIVTDPLTITGGLGVTASYLEFSELMDEYGIEHVELKEGELKEMGSPYRNITDEEEDIFKDILNQTQTDFITTVSENRELTDEELEEVATGRIFTGKDGKEVGLIDELGARGKAEQIVEDHLNETVNFKEYRREPGILQLLLGSEEDVELKTEEVAQKTELEIPKLYALDF